MFDVDEHKESLRRLWDSGNHQETFQHSVDGLNAAIDEYGEGSQKALDCLQHHAYIAKGIHNYAEAIKSFESLLSYYRTSDVEEIKNNAVGVFAELAELHWSLDDTDLAEIVFKDLGDFIEKELDESEFNYGRLRLLEFYVNVEKIEEALSLSAKIQGGIGGSVNKKNPQYWSFLDLVFKADWLAESYEEAEECLNKLLQAIDSEGAEQSELRVQTYLQLSDVYIAKNDAVVAYEYSKKAWEEAHENLDKCSDISTRAQRRFATITTVFDKELASQLLAQTWATVYECFGYISVSSLDLLEDLFKNYSNLGEDTESILRTSCMAFCVCDLLNGPNDERSISLFDSTYTAFKSFNNVLDEEEPSLDEFIEQLVLFFEDVKQNRNYDSPTQEMLDEDEIYQITENIGSLFRKIDKVPLAVDTFEKLSHDYPDRHLPLVYLASCKYDLGKLEEALSLVRAALKIEDSDTDLYTLLGDIYVGLEDYPRAIDAYDKAISIDDTYLYAYELKGDALYRGRRFAEACVIFRGLFDQHYRNCTEQVEQMGYKHPMVEIDGEEKLLLDPLSTYNQRINQLVRRANYGASLLNRKGLCKYSLGKYEEAKDAFEEALAWSQEGELYQPALNNLEKLMGVE